MLTVQEFPIYPTPRIPYYLTSYISVVRLLQLVNIDRLLLTKIHTLFIFFLVLPNILF